MNSPPTADNKINNLANSKDAILLIPLHWRPVVHSKQPAMCN